MTSDQLIYYQQGHEAVAVHLRDTDPGYSYLIRGAYLKKFENTIRMGEVEMSSKSDGRRIFSNLPALPPLGRHPTDPQTTSTTQPGSRGKAAPVQTQMPNWRPVTVYIDSELLDSVDKVGFSIRSPTGARLNRSAVIRAMLRAVVEAGIDTADVQTEEDLKDLVLERIRGY
jgi:hypothetical protein